MKPYLASLAVGALVGALYATLDVRSPAPPAVALLGLLGMLLGERGLPLARRMLGPPAVVTTSEGPRRADAAPGKDASAP